MRKVAAKIEKKYPQYKNLKILFLGYDEKKTTLIKKVSRLGLEVWHTEEKIKSLQNFDLAISYGYKHILKTSVIHQSIPVINLHIGYLPYNRGAHPNFWAFYENTPSGVTIHIADDGIDSGDIIYQKYVTFLKSEITFAQTYQRLIKEIEKLFIENVENILLKKYIPKKQKGKGTYHKLDDLPEKFVDWDAIIDDEIKRIKKLEDSSATKS